MMFGTELADICLNFMKLKIDATEASVVISLTFTYSFQN